MTVVPDEIPVLAEQIRQRDRRALARGITLVESTRPEHREAADSLIAHLLPFSGRSIRLGLTGVPGAGKSTLIEALGRRLIDRGRQVAVLAIDPSSPRSGGSILGDKTRMDLLARDPNAFIRPTPAGGHLGGVARRTREAMILCEAAGFDLILIETVGVGQSEMAVAQMVDMFLLVLVPGGGDELQGLKKGIVEMADMILVNKADGDLIPAAERAVQDYRNALHLLRSDDPDWTVPVLACSAMNGAGLDQVWDDVQTYHARRDASGGWAARRRAQAIDGLWQEARDLLIGLLRTAPDIDPLRQRLEQEAASGRTLPATAAARLVKGFLDSRG